MSDLFIYIDNKYPYPVETFKSAATEKAKDSVKKEVLDATETKAIFTSTNPEKEYDSTANENLIIKNKYNKCALKLNDYLELAMLAGRLSIVKKRPTKNDRVVKSGFIPETSYGWLNTITKYTRTQITTEEIKVREKTSKADSDIMLDGTENWFLWDRAYKVVKKYGEVKLDSIKAYLCKDLIFYTWKSEYYWLKRQRDRILSGKYKKSAEKHNNQVNDAILRVRIERNKASKIFGKDSTYYQKLKKYADIKVERLEELKLKPRPPWMSYADMLLGLLKSIKKRNKVDAAILKSEAAKIMQKAKAASGRKKVSPQGMVALKAIYQNTLEAINNIDALYKEVSPDKINRTSAAIIQGIYNSTKISSSIYKELEFVKEVKAYTTGIKTKVKSFKNDALGLLEIYKGTLLPFNDDVWFNKRTQILVNLKKLLKKSGQNRAWKGLNVSLADLYQYWLLTLIDKLSYKPNRNLLYDYIHDTIIRLTKSIYEKMVENVPKYSKPYKILLTSKNLKEYANNLKLLKKAMGSFVPDNEGKLKSF